MEKNKRNLKAELKYLNSLLLLYSKDTNYCKRVQSEIKRVQEDLEYEEEKARLKKKNLL